MFAQRKCRWLALDALAPSRDKLSMIGEQEEKPGIENGDAEMPRVSLIEEN
jgi:hypothetical protein